MTETNTPTRHRASLGRYLEDFTVGDVEDNAMVESFFASLESELINRRSWKIRAEARP